jgi:AcrR family transcriptional regulator
MLAYREPVSRSEASRPYHHGDLRHAVIEEAVQAIAEDGPGALSLRDVARRLGVSHAAPTHHFGDKAGLLTAVAAEGFRLLARELGRAYERTGSFREVGVAYVRFAIKHRPYFDVMFRPELLHDDDPELTAARKESASTLYGPVSEHRGAAAADGRQVMEAGVAAWSLVHGLATLYLNGNLPAQLGKDPEQIARSLVGYLFGPGDGRRR